MAYGRQVLRIGDALSRRRLEPRELAEIAWAAVTDKLPAGVVSPLLPNVAPASGRSRCRADARRVAYPGAVTARTMSPCPRRERGATRPGVNFRQAICSASPTSGKRSLAMSEQTVKRRQEQGRQREGRARLPPRETVVFSFVGPWEDRRS